MRSKHLAHPTQGGLFFWLRLLSTYSATLSIRNLPPPYGEAGAMRKPSGLSKPRVVVSTVRMPTRVSQGKCSSGEKVGVALALIDFTGFDQRIQLDTGGSSHRTLAPSA